ncbi:MAG TPA: DegT/DnrJ/EryC1/StrS family aminotransferase, partial [Gemmatimonadales bacterium]|nr:DegT/DnrJ/EryC1/StrS family aminotransferase [Gemmatimonadales bacterium]
MTRLAIDGGRPIRSTPFPVYQTMGREERDAVNRVLDSGVLSQFLGTWSADFNGGPRVQELERKWAEYFGVRHAISVNSATSGLYAAIGALDLNPGDEVIVSPYTMSASAAGIMLYNGVPVFADIDPATYCLSPASVRRAITPRTRAIMIPDIFGHPADFDAFQLLAREHGLVLIEDAAQAPGARYRGRWAGTLGHMGVFSLNYHKTIHSGEGGVIVTDNDDLADRLRLIRNHGEAVVKAMGAPHLSHIIGFNYRMTEIEAAIATVQLGRLEGLTTPREEATAYLRERWAGLPGITPATTATDCRHAWYVMALQVDSAELGTTRDWLVEALAAEGVPFGRGYVEPLYLQPIYQQRAFAAATGSRVSYARGLCPVTE